METKNEKKTQKPKSANVSTTPIRVKRETLRTIINLLAKINKKDFGRKAKPDELVALGLSFIGEAEIRNLQDRTLSNADRLDIQYREYVKKHGPITKDAFLGTLLEKGNLAEAREVQDV